MSLAPGIYFDIKEADYHADPCAEPSLSASIAKVLLFKSPRHAWFKHPRLNPDFEPVDNAKFDIGKAAHSLMLHDERTFVVVEEDDWRKNAAKEAREAAYRAGKTPILAYQMKNVEAMVKAGRLQIAAHGDSSDAFVGGKSEVTIVWQEEGIWLRIRIDNMIDLTGGGIMFYDYKTTEASANPDTFDRTFFQMNYDLTSAFYRRGIRAILDIKNPQYKFVVQECEEPHALSVIGLNPETEGVADRKVDEAIRIWAHCLKNNCWPGYPNRTAYIGAPAYHEKSWLEREERESDGKPTLEQALNWQAPPNWKGVPPQNKKEMQF